MTDLFDVMYNCRAMRRLDSKPVLEELLLKLIEAVNQTPSGFNRQRARWIIVRNAEQREHLATLNKKAVEAYVRHQSGRAEELPHQSAEKRQRMLDSVFWQAEHMQELPALVMACFEFDGPVEAGEDARAGGSIWPSVQNTLLAARALGLGAALTTLGLSDCAASPEALGLTENIEAFALIPIGHPLGNLGPGRRLPVAETMRWDRWSETWVVPVPVSARHGGWYRRAARVQSNRPGHHLNLLLD